jgi:hypothetical protein
VKHEVRKNHYQTTATVISNMKKYMVERLSWDLQEIIDGGRVKEYI